MNSRDDNRGLLEAIGVHPAVGYVDLGHLAPAIMGAMTFVLGIAFCYQPMVSAGRNH